MESQVAKIILDQIGGKRALTMLGFTRLTYTDDSLIIKFNARAKNRANCLNIVLDPTDVYRVEFWRIGQNADVRLIEETRDIYAEQLREVITHRTGLYLSL